MLLTLCLQNRLLVGHPQLPNSVLHIGGFRLGLVAAGLGERSQYQGSVKPSSAEFFGYLGVGVWFVVHPSLYASSNFASESLSFLWRIRQEIAVAFRRHPRAQGAGGMPAGMPRKAPAKKPANRKPAKRRVPASRALETQAQSRHGEALRLKISGLSFRAIGEKLGVHHSVAQDYVAAALAETQAMPE